MFAFLKRNIFSVISWIVTFILVAGITGAGMWYRNKTQAEPALVPEPTAQPDKNPPDVTMPVSESAGGGGNYTIERGIHLKTIIPERPRYTIEKYTVQRGDSVFRIADEFKLTPETVFWANYEVFDGSPSSIKPGQVLDIPPVDGIYYTWEKGDTIESVADKFNVEPDAIINWTGNNIDLTTMQIEPGTLIMIPGGERNDQPLFIQTATISGSSSSGGSACGGGFTSQGFFNWPTSAHYLSGYDFGQNGHNGIDISAPEGTPIYAADNGVVTMAQGGWNYGYGNVVQIDHGNGFVTLYAHLSSINVGVCQSVGAGALIGYSGNTGNSQGAHLHFEIRVGGSPQNPWNFLP